MRLRGRRIALLLAGALPLLADDSNFEQQQSHDPDQQPRKAQQDESQQPVASEDDAKIDDIPLTAVESVHDDAFKIPPLNAVTATSADDRDITDDTSRPLEVDTKDELVSKRSQIVQEVEEGTEVGEGIHEDNKEKTIYAEPPDSQEQEHVILDSLSSVVGQLWDRVGSADLKDGDDGTDADAKDGENTANESKGIADSEEATDVSTVEGDFNSTKAAGQREQQHDSSDRPIDEKVKEVSTTGEYDNEESLSGDSKALDQVAEVVEDASQEAINETSAVFEDSHPAEVEEDNLTDRVAVDYASKSAGALILEKSSSFKGTSNLLNEDKDKYAIAPCEEKKFVVVGLSEDILVKQIILANYERFSSRVKEFQVLGSQTMGKWVDLGTYTAKAGNGKQTFDLLEPAWARYIKFKFRTHHGSEYYCTLSQIKVHGSTMLQGFHEQWEDDDEHEVGKVEESSSIQEALEGDTNNVSKDDIHPGSLISEAVPSEGVKTDDSPDDEDDSACDTSSDSEDTKIADPEQNSLGRFRESQSLDNMLHGFTTDEELFTTMYDLIPQVLGARSTESLSSPGRKNESDMKTFHQLSTAAIESVYRSSQIASNVAKSLVAGTSKSIETPKMSDAVGDFAARFKHTLTGMLADADPQPRDSKTIETDYSHATDEPKQVSEEALVNMESEGSLDSEQKVDEPKVNDMVSEATKADDGSSEELPETHEDVVSINQEKPREQPAEAAALDASARTVDVALVRMLERLPSASCLPELDYAEFKAKILASRKTPPGGGSTGGGGEKAPIFKKLTDEIKALQMSLSAHDQFTKASVSCYQRVLLDLVAESEKMRSGHEERLSRLEAEMERARRYTISSIWSWVRRGLFLGYLSTKWVVDLLVSGPSLAFDGVVALWRYRRGNDSSLLPKSVSAAIAFLQEGQRARGANAIFEFVGQKNHSWLLPFILMLFALLGLLIPSRARKDKAAVVAVKSNSTLSSSSQTAKKEDIVEDEVPPMVDDESTSEVSNIRPDGDLLKKRAYNKKNESTLSGFKGSPCPQQQQRRGEAKMEDAVPTMLDEKSDF